MYRTFLLSACALFAGLAAGCGSLANDTEHQDPLTVLQGELSNPESLTGFTSLHIAVLWSCGDVKGSYLVSQQVEIQPVFPLRFRLQLTEPPPAECMLDPLAEETVDNPASGPETEPSGPGNTPQSHGSSSDLRVGIGTIVAYDDLNGNGKLDLVDPSALQYEDAILGANKSLVLVYVEGSSPGVWDEMVDSDGNLPSPGYNLVDMGSPLSSDLDDACTHPSQVDESAPIPEEGSNNQEASRHWMDVSTTFVLEMSADPEFALMMCSTTDWSGSSSSSSPPSLTCMSDGLSYYSETCSDEGVCRGKSCAGSCHYVQDVSNPPTDWPCPIP